MELKEVYEIWDRFDASNATKLELEISGTKICLERQIESAVRKEHEMISKEAFQKKELLKENLQKEDLQKEDLPKETLLKEEGDFIKAPLVGTFYSAPSPDASPYAEEGKSVKKGEVVGIIEAMKLMNEITAPYDCRIKKVLVENEQFVAYDDELFVIERN